MHDDDCTLAKERQEREMDEATVMSRERERWDTRQGVARLTFDGGVLRLSESPGSRPCIDKYFSFFPEMFLKVFLSCIHKTFYPILTSTQFSLPRKVSIM